MGDVEFLGGNLVEDTVFCVVAGSVFVMVDWTGLRVVSELGLGEVCVGLCTVVVRTGLFVVVFEAAAVTLCFVTFSVLGRRLEDVVDDGFVGLLVVLGDTVADGLLLTVPMMPTVLFDKVASVLEVPSGALCTVWNVESRVVCVVVSIVVVVGFLVTNFVVSLNTLVEACALGVLELTDVVWNFAKIIDP